ncbi:MAG: type II toxin-antitoxin system RelE/ParE family toxin [archaeon]
MNYEIKYSAKALKQLGKLDRQTQTQVLKRIEKLSENPFLAKPLSNRLKNNFSERVGKIRIIFSISGNEMDIAKIGHRKSVYG